MGAVIPWAEGELQSLAADRHSRVFSDLRKITVVLQPFHLQDLKTAVRDLLNASVDCYDKSLDGIFLGYDKLKVLSKSASVAAESSGVAIEIQAVFYSFRPEIGCILKGIVNKISKDHVGILVYQRFNVTCPRPGLDSKSAKWIGNSVVMHQEVVFKLREKNFSGKLPYFKGKIMEIGNVVTGLSEQDKKPKKKSKDVVPDESNLTEASSQVTKKSRKHKLEQSNENIEVKSKKSKKEVETLKRPVEKDADVSVAGSELSSLKKNKKKVSISSVDETDFIPRFSLDVSQLPEDLPPPNADSTHFDLAKNLSGSFKTDKKKKKAKSSDLTAIGEESADGSKVNSKVIDRSHQISEEKPKKKLKTSTQEPSASEDTRPVKTAKKKNLKESADLNLPPPISPKKILKQAVVESPPVKDKNSKTARSVNNSQLNTLPQNEAHGSKGSVGIELKDQLSPTKVKKKSKEDKTSPAKEKKSKGEKSIPSPTKGKVNEIVSCSLTSDDIIPPGQKSFRASPKKHLGGSPRKDESHPVSIAHSPGIEYFAASRSMMDSELGTRRSGRQVPLMFGSLEGKIPGPPESPIKSSAAKEVESDSDSDSPPPKKLASPIKSSAAKKVESDSDSDSTPRKKLVISTKCIDDSDSSDAENGQAAAQSKMLPQKMTEDDSDETDFETAVQNRLLQSMGVMQSPFKTATPVVNHGPSESESADSSDEDRLSSKVSNINSADTKHVPKGPQNQTKGQESDSDDDVDAIKAAMLKVAENRQSKIKPSKSKPSKLAPNDKVASSKTSMPEKESISKRKKNVSDKNSKPIDDSDSDTDFIQSAMVKVKEMTSSGSSLPKAKQGKKSKSEKLDVPAKKTKAAPADKIKPKPGNMTSSASQVTSNDLKTKRAIDDSDDDVENEVLKAAMQNLAPGGRKGKSKVTPAKKSKLKSSENNPDSDDSDDDENEVMKAAIQAAVKNKSEKKSKHENLDVVSKKTKAAPADKMKSKPGNMTSSASQVISNDLKTKPAIDDSDDDAENDVLKAAMLNLATVDRKGKSKVTPAKKSKLKSSESISTSVSKMISKGSENKPHSDDSDDDEEVMKAAIQAVIKTKSEKKAKRENLAKAAAAEKTKLKPSKKTSTSVSQVPLIDDSDDEAENEALKAAMQNLPQKDKSMKGKKLPNKSEPEPTAKSSLPRVSNISGALDDSDSDSDDLNTTSRIESMKGKKLPNRSKPEPTAKSSLPRVSNISGVSDDSDSGPDDLNTTSRIKEIRQKQSEVKAMKPAKNQKNSDGEKSLSVNSSKSSSKKNKQNEKAALVGLQDVSSDTKKGKTSKGNTSKKVALEQSSTPEKNQKLKVKKKAEADDEISNVMQRLMKQARLGKL